MKTIYFPLIAAAAIGTLASGLTGAQEAVDLGTASDFAILSKAGVSTTGVTSVTGDMAVSPAAATAITGFTLTLDDSNEYSKSPFVTGKIYAADYDPPTPAKLTTVVSDMEIAYTDAAGRTLPDATELGAGNVDDMTLAPGLYKWASGLMVTTEVTLEGCPEDVWIFQIGGNLTVGNGAIIHLTGGARAANIFWQVAGEVTLGTTARFEGTLLSQTAIHLNTGASINGRLLAQTAVTLNGSTVVSPPGPAVNEERLLNADSISRAVDGEVTLSFTVTPGHLVSVEESTDLKNWETISTTVPAASPYVVTRATSLSDERRFYRAFYPCE